MTDFVHETYAGRVVFGAGTLLEAALELEAVGVERVLLIGGGSAKGFADDLAERLGDRVAARVTEVAAHVPFDDVIRVRSLAASAGIDAVLAVGGGSAIGLGKAVVLEHPGVSVAVPTTYSGSEMTPIYGITDGGVKRTGRHPAVRPRVAVYDPELTLGLPPAITAGSAMNAMAHCVEALYAENRNPITSMMAGAGVGAVHRGLLGTVADPGDLAARTELMFGAHLGGAALGSVGMAIHHRICHVLGGTFGVGHGNANAVILPHVVSANASAEQEAIAMVAAALGTDDAAGALFDLATTAGAPTDLARLGVGRQELDRATALVVEHTPYNPRPVEPGWVRELLEDAFEGTRPSTRGRR